MKIEEGKYYRTRDGRKVGPMKLDEDSFSARFHWIGDGNGADYDNSGRDCDNDDCVYHLIAEWPDEPASPVRTVTRKEIVEGDYGVVTVGSTIGSTVSITLDGSREGWVRVSAEQIREAAKVFTEIADALDEQGAFK